MEKYISFVPNTQQFKLKISRIKDRGYHSQEENNNSRTEFKDNDFNEREVFDLFNRQQVQNTLLQDFKTLSNLYELKRNFQLHENMKYHFQLHKGDEGLNIEDMLEEYEQTIIYTARSGKSNISIVGRARNKTIARRYTKFNFDLSVLNVSDNDPIVVIRQRADTAFRHPFKSLIFGPMVSYVQFQAHLTLIHRGLSYSTRCLKSPSEKYIKNKQLSLQKPHHNKDYTLFLDLDETLIHTCPMKDNPDHIIKVLDEVKCEQKQGLLVRPYCQEFLESASKNWNIYAFTASTFNYATAVLKVIDPKRKYFSGILAREHCMQTRNGFFIKDLRIIKKLNLEKVLIVDNLAHSFGFQIENGIPILEWHNDKLDYQLKYLIFYLNQAVTYKDVRNYNRDNLQLIKLSETDLDDL